MSLSQITLPNDHIYHFPTGAPDYSPVNHAWNTETAINDKGETFIYELYDPSIPYALVEASAEYEYYLNIPSAAPIETVETCSISFGKTDKKCCRIIRRGKPKIKECTQNGTLEPLAVLQGLARYLKELSVSRVHTSLSGSVCHGFISPKVIFADPGTKEISVSGTNLRRLAILYGQKEWWKSSSRPDAYSLAFRTYRRNMVSLEELTTSDDIWAACMTVLCLCSEELRKNPLGIGMRSLGSIMQVHEYLSTHTTNHIRWIQNAMSQVKNATSRAIIQKGLHVDPAKRFSDVEEFFAACYATSLSHKRSTKAFAIGSEMVPQLEIIKAEIFENGFSRFPILITGPTGSGKTSSVDQIHHFIHGGNKKKTLVKLNCGRFNNDLIDAHLFGYLKGAYTGAIRDTMGVIESAEDGTVFLDEVDSLSLQAQVKLFELFDKDRSFLRLGESKPTNKVICKCTFILGTNKDLRELVRNKVIRRDFFNRITIYPPIDIKPVTERKEELHDALLQEWKENASRVYHLAPDLHLPRETLDVFLEARFPDNFRSAQKYMKLALCLLLKEERNMLTVDDARRIIDDAENWLDDQIAESKTDSVESIGITERLQKLASILRKNPEIDRGRASVQLDWKDEKGKTIQSKARAGQILRREIINIIKTGKLHRPPEISEDDWDIVLRFCEERQPGRRKRPVMV